jgi:hypothetical protein
MVQEIQIHSRVNGQMFCTCYDSQVLKKSANIYTIIHVSSMTMF